MSHKQMVWSLIWILLSTMACEGGTAGKKEQLADEDHDEAALRALDQAYATAWMNGDADGVMALFTEDATLVPHHGVAPVKGQDGHQKKLV